MTRSRVTAKVTRSRVTAKVTRSRSVSVDVKSAKGTRFRGDRPAQDHRRANRSLVMMTRIRVTDRHDRRAGLATEPAFSFSRLRMRAREGQLPVRAVLACVRSPCASVHSLLDFQQDLLTLLPRPHTRSPV